MPLDLPPNGSGANSWKPETTTTYKKPEPKTPENTVNYSVGLQNNLEGGSPGPFEKVRLEVMLNNGDMPGQIKRYQFFVTESGVEENGGSVFAWPAGSVKSELISRQLHPELFDNTGTIIPEKLKAFYKNQGKEFALTSAMGYTDGNGGFDGLAIEGGKTLNDQFNPKNKALIYFNPDGSIKFSHTTFDENLTNGVFDINKVKSNCSNGGSVIQGKYLYREGVPVLDLSNTGNDIKWRTLIKCGNYYAFVNITKGIDGDDLEKSFDKIKEALETQFGTMEFAVLCDTGVCSTGAFATNKGDLVPMVDKQFPPSKQSSVIAYSF